MGTTHNRRPTASHSGIPVTLTGNMAPNIIVL